MPQRREAGGAAGRRAQLPGGRQEGAAVGLGAAEAVAGGGDDEGAAADGILGGAVDRLNGSGHVGDGTGEAAEEAVPAEGEVEDETARGRRLREPGAHLAAQRLAELAQGADVAAVHVVALARRPVLAVEGDPGQGELAGHVRPAGAARAQEIGRHVGQGPAVGEFPGKVSAPVSRVAPESSRARRVGSPAVAGRGAWPDWSRK